MGYAEEIFSRRESDINELRSYDNILSWLIQDKNGNAVRKQTSEIRDIAKELSEQYELEEEMEGYTTTAELRGVLKRINSLPVGKDRLFGIYNDKIAELDKIESGEFEQMIQDTSSLGELDSIESEIESSDITSKSRLLSQISQIRRTGEGILQENERLLAEKETLSTQFDTAQTVQDRDEAERRLNEIDRRIVANKRRGESIRGIKALRIFD